METVLWDRKAEGGFPETKELKNRVRNVIEPGRDLGHIDRSLKKNQQQRLDPTGGEEVAIDGNGQPPVATESEYRKPKNESESGKIEGADAEAALVSKAECEDCK